VPLPESTQWELMAPLAAQAQPIFAELVAQAANAPVLHHDDTTMRILDLRRPGSTSAAQIEHARTGTFTTNILAEVAQHPVALYFTGWQHAGGNLAAVLRQRAKDLAPPIQMCDALSRNRLAEFDTLLAHCASHARREFVAVAPSFPDECRYVLDSFRDVYRFDAEAKQLGLNPAAQLVHHQTHSQPVRTRLKEWLEEKIRGKHVEPNSGVGQAIRLSARTLAAADVVAAPRRRPRRRPVHEPDTYLPAQSDQSLCLSAGHRDAREFAAMARLFPVLAQEALGFLSAPLQARFKASQRGAQTRPLRWFVRRRTGVGSSLRWVRVQHGSAPIVAQCRHWVTHVCRSYTLKRSISSVTRQPKGQPSPCPSSRSYSRKHRLTGRA